MNLAHFFFWNFLILSRCHKNGFSDFLIQPNNPSVIENITNSSIVVSLYQSDPYSLKIEYYNLKGQNISRKFTTKGTFIFNCKKIIFIALEKEQKLAVWQVPKNYCNYSIVLQAENQLDVTVVKINQQFPICLFTQFSGNHFFLTLSITPDSQSSVSFYSKDIFKPHSCRNKYNCEFNSFKPFFTQISNLNSRNEFRMTLSYKVNINPAQKDASCSILSLPTVTEKGFHILPAFASDSAVVCTNLAQGTMNTIISLIVTILLTITVLFLIHCIGAIHSLHICNFDEQLDEFSGYHKACVKDDLGPLLE